MGRVDAWGSGHSMALSLGARSLGLRRLLHHWNKFPGAAGLAAFEAWHGNLLARGGCGSADQSNLRDAGSLKAGDSGFTTLVSKSLDDSVCSGATSLFHTKFHALAIEPIEEEDDFSEVEREGITTVEEDRADGSAKDRAEWTESAEKAETKGGSPEGGRELRGGTNTSERDKVSVEGGGVGGAHPPRLRDRWRRELELELLLRLRAWPFDVDLSEKLGEGKLEGVNAPISTHVVKRVLYSVAHGRASLPEPEIARGSRSGSEEGDFGKRGLEGRPVDEIRYRREDALRALNLFFWWQRRNAEAPLVPMLSPLLKVLAKGGLQDELRLVWAWYKDQGKVDSFRAVGAFLSAFSSVGGCDEVLEVYMDARENDWPVPSHAVDLVVQRMYEKGCSKDEVWAFYRGAVGGSRNEPHEPQTFVALLKSGVTVLEIRSLKYDEPHRIFNLLIQALGREAGELVQELVNRSEALASHSLVAFIRTLLRLEFVPEAQELADKQVELGLGLDAALIEVMKRARDAEAARVGLRAYEKLLPIERPHRTSLRVQAERIRLCHLLKRTEEMYQAYVLGKQLDGHFGANTFAHVIEELALNGRTVEAEEVLADYFALRKKALGVGMLADSAFKSLAHAYLRADQPHKLAELVTAMERHQQFVKEGVVEKWTRGVINNWAKPVGALDRAADTWQVVKAALVDLGGLGSPREHPLPLETRPARTLRETLDVGALEGGGTACTWGAREEQGDMQRLSGVEKSGELYEDEGGEETKAVSTGEEQALGGEERRGIEGDTSKEQTDMEKKGGVGEVAMGGGVRMSGSRQRETNVYTRKRWGHVGTEEVWEVRLHQRKRESKLRLRSWAKEQLDKREHKSSQIMLREA